MSKPPADKPASPAAKPDRAGREAVALRANLLKRKDQARQREKAKDEAMPGQDPHQNKPV